MNYNFYLTSPSYTNYVNKLCELKREFPFLCISSIGQSVLGREIYCISIGNPQRGNLFVGAFHAQEWLTCTLLMRYLEHLCVAQKEKTTVCNKNLTDSLKQRGLFFIPMINPDGVSIVLEGATSAGYLKGKVEAIAQSSKKSWQANARGVDLNHNFNAGFQELKFLEKCAGITSPSPRQYGGENPHSEPETRSLIAFLNSHDIDAAYAFHSQGEEIYYEYGKYTPVKSDYTAKLLAAASGYKLVKNAGLASHGGFKDYFIERYHKSGYTIEIGKGENPLPISDLEGIYEKLLEALVIASVI